MHLKVEIVENGFWNGKKEEDGKKKNERRFPRDKSEEKFCRGGKCERML